MSAEGIGMVTAAFVIIGNEVLSGRTQDANLAPLALALNRVGVQLREVRVVPDVTAEIAAAVNAVRARYDYVFTSGGIGPTHDDITTAAVAAAFGVAVLRHPEATAILEAYYKPEDRTPARMKMAEIPAGATLVYNPVSQAPGFRLGNVFVLAGVPKIFRAMLDGVLPQLKGGRSVLSVTVASKVREGVLAAGLAAIQASWPDIDIGSYPSFDLDNFGTAIVLRGVEPDRLSAAAAEVVSLIRSLGGLPTVSSPPAEGVAVLGQPA